MIKRFTLPMMFVLVIAMLAACSESPPPSPEPTATVQVAPTATATSTPVPTPSPTPVVPFEDSLSSADLAGFQALPVEIQEALIDESLESGNESALRYLRDMPDDPASACGDTWTGNADVIGQYRRAVSPSTAVGGVSQLDHPAFQETVAGGRIYRPRVRVWRLRVDGPPFA